MPWPGASSARRAYRARRATTTSTTPTTRTGRRARASVPAASRASARSGAPLLRRQQSEQRRAGTDALGPPGFTLATLRQVMFANRNLSAELARDDTVAACRASARADLAEACAVLAAWDMRSDTGSRGAVLW